MKPVLFAAALVLATTAAARADVSILDNDQTVTVDCAKDKSVSILGNKATVTLKGTCDAVNVAGNKASVKGSAVRVHVAGNDNTLALDAADEILVSGNKNTVSYKKGIKEKAPRVSSPGSDNKVGLAK